MSRVVVVPTPDGVAVGRTRGALRGAEPRDRAAVAPQRSALDGSRRVGRELRAKAVLR